MNLKFDYLAVAKAFQFLSVDLKLNDAVMRIASSVVKIDVQVA